MTIQELITKVGEEKPNAFTTQKLVSFINEIEADVAQVLKVDTPNYVYTDLTSVLLVPAPYDRLYVSYLKAMIDYADEEMESYVNNAAQHTQDFTEFENWVVRTNQVVDNPFPRRFRHVM